MEGQVVGGALFHFLAEAGSGFSSFLGVARSFRRHGVARLLHEERMRLLERASQGRVVGVFIDVVNPTRLSAAELERERQAARTPGIAAAPSSTWASNRWTSATSSPSAARTAGPVTILDLLFCPRSPSATVATSLVVATMRAYWSPWLGNAAAHYANELESRAGGAKELALISPVPAGPP